MAWALIPWTTQLQVEGIKLAGGVLAHLATSSVTAHRLTRSCMREGGIGMGCLDEGLGLGWLHGLAGAPWPLRHPKPRILSWHLLGTLLRTVARVTYWWPSPRGLVVGFGLWVKG